MKRSHPLIAAAVSASTLALAASVLVAQTTQPSAREQRLSARASAKVNAEAAELFRTADTTYLVGDLSRASDLYRQILTVAPGSIFTVRVTARLGDCAYEAKSYDQAVQHYRQASSLAAGATDPEEQAAAVRADYMIGQSHLMAKQQIQAFGAFRRFIDKHPSDPLVNKAYQSIGDGHMAVQQYQQALEAYRMVGTVFDRSQTPTNRIAPGQRLYLRVADADVNIGDTPRSVYAIVRAKSGDVERVELKPLGLRSPVFIATIPTQLGPPLRSGDLNDAFPEDGNQRVRDLLTKADNERARATERSRELAELKRQGEGADPAGFEKQRASLEDIVNSHNRLAIDLQKQAFDMVDRGFAKIELLLNAWSPDLSLAQTKTRLLATTQPAQPPAEVAPAVDPSMAEAMARPLVAEDEPAQVDAERRGMTQAEIDRMRIAAAESPTDLTNIDKRLIALSIWHRALSRQFQRLEIAGNDALTVEYVDEVGPEGPNETSKSLRRDTIDVASDARVAILTPDGAQPISQAVLGGTVLLQVEDTDRDVSHKRDTLKVTLCAIERPDEKLLELRSQTEAKAEAKPAERQTPGLIAAATTQPSEILPLVVEGSKNIELTLTETSEHSGLFAAALDLSKDGAKDLPLDPKKQLRLAYRDDRAIRNKDSFVHAIQIDCIEDRGGSVAAVRYRQTQLDLQAKLARAVASGEIGKIYLELGLDSRGKSYLSAAQADCREVAQAAGKSPLGEQSLYHSWRIYFYAGLLDESVAAANRLIQAYPLSEYCDDAMLAIGEASLEQGKKSNEESIASGRPASLNRDLQRAVNQLDSLVKTYPNSPLAPQALFLIGQAKISAGQTGLDAFEQLAKQFPDSGFAAKGLIQAADYYVSIADYRRAQEYFGRVLIDYPDSPQRGDVLLRRGVCQYKLGQNADALTTLYQVAEEHSGTDLAAEARKYINTINQSRGDAQ